MSRRSGAFALCLATMVLLTGCGRAEPSATYSDFKKIKGGMTYQQVAAVVGFEGRKRAPGERVIGAIVPADNDPDDEVYVWMNPDGSNLSVDFRQKRAVGFAQWELCSLHTFCFMR